MTNQDAAEDLESEPVPDWFEPLIEANTYGYQRPRWEPALGAPHGQRFVFAMQSLGHGSTPMITLAAMPPGEEVEVVIQSPSQWTVAEVAKDCIVHLRREDRAQSSIEATVRLAVSVLGTIRMSVGPSHSGRITTDEGCPATLVLVEGAHQPSDIASKVRLELLGGALGSGTYGVVHLLGDSSVTPNSNQDPVAVDDLVVHGERTLTVAATTRMSIDVVTGDAEETSTLWIRQAPDQNMPGGRNMDLTVKEFADVRICVHPPTRVIGIAKAFNVEFTGSSPVRFEGKATGSNLRFIPDGAPSRLVANTGSILMGLSGEVSLGAVQGAHLEASSPKAFRIAAIAASDLGARDNLCKDSFLRGFTLPSGLTGRRLLNDLAEAHHLEPATSNLAGWEYRLLGRRGPRRWLKGEQWPDSTSRQHDAELMRELRRLAHERGASGSARTKVGWCAQRLRHVTTRGRMERAALSGYRLLGYGERPGPALLTWAVLSMVAAVLVLGLEPDWSWHGVRVFARETATQATGPLAAVMRSGASSLTHQWEYLVRAIVAVPLVVGILSLRNYVRPGS